MACPATAVAISGAELAGVRCLVPTDEGAISVDAGASVPRGADLIVGRPELLAEPLMRRIVESCPRSISIAIDGCDARSHDGYRGTAHGFARALAALETFHHLGVATGVLTHVRSHNVDQLADIGRIPAWLGAQEWSISFAAPPATTVGDRALGREQQISARSVLAALAICAPQLRIAIDPDDVRVTGEGAWPSPMRTRT